MKILFISGKYRADSIHEIYENIHEARQVALKYWKRGYAVICPHMNSALFDGASDDETWLYGDLEILSRCDGIVMMRNWTGSNGARAEYERAKELGLQIIFD